MTGVDASAQMLELASRRLGADADLRVADLAGALPFPECILDDVVASLVLRYLKDWGPTLAELRRVLTPVGRPIVSVDHPSAIFLRDRSTGGDTSYFQTRGRTEDWTMGGHSAQLTF